MGQLDSEIFFSRAEGESLKKRLDQFEAELVDRLKKSSLDKTAVEYQITAIDQDIRSLKAQVTAVPKGSWIKKLAIRLGIWASDPTNQKLLETGGHVIKTLIAHDPGQQHPKQD